MHRVWVSLISRINKKSALSFVLYIPSSALQLSASCPGQSFFCRGISILPVLGLLRLHLKSYQSFILFIKIKFGFTQLCISSSKLSKLIFIWNSWIQRLRKLFSLQFATKVFRFTYDKPGRKQNSSMTKVTMESEILSIK